MTKKRRRERTTQPETSFSLLSPNYDKVGDGVVCVKCKGQTVQMDKELIDEVPDEHRIFRFTYRCKCGHRWDEEKRIGLYSTW